MASAVGEVQWFRYRGRLTPDDPGETSGMTKGYAFPEVMESIKEMHGRHPGDWHEVVITENTTGKVRMKRSAPDKPHVRLPITDGRARLVTPGSTTLPVVVVPTTPVVVTPPVATDPRFIRNGFRNQFKVMKA